MSIVIVLAPFSIIATDGGETPPASDNVVVITEDIDSNSTWEGDKIYLIRAWDFYVNATLVIEAGAIVKFHPIDGPYLVLGGSGTITANGTVANPIIFTSYKDNAHGGDTNGDGAATAPANGDWDGIYNNTGLWETWPNILYD